MDKKTKTLCLRVSCLVSFNFAHLLKCPVPLQIFFVHPYHVTAFFLHHAKKTPPITFIKRSVFGDKIK